MHFLHCMPNTVLHLAKFLTRSRVVIAFLKEWLLLVHYGVIRNPWPMFLPKYFASWLLSFGLKSTLYIFFEIPCFEHWNEIPYYFFDKTKVVCSVKVFCKRRYEKSKGLWLLYFFPSGFLLSFCGLVLVLNFKGSFRTLPGVFDTVVWNDFYEKVHIP